jgi:hypothetical protein
VRLFFSAIAAAICDLVSAFAIFYCVLLIDVCRTPIKAGWKRRAKKNLPVLLMKLRFFREPLDID